MTEDSVVALHHPGVTADPLTEVLRAGARELLAQAIEAEVAAVLAAHEHLKTEDGRRRLVRHGHGPERAILTGIGPVSVRRPKVRDRGSVGGERIRFTSAILPRFARRTRSLDAVLPTLYLRGVSSGDFQEALEALTPLACRRRYRPPEGGVGGRARALVPARPVGPTLRLHVGRWHPSPGSAGGREAMHSGPHRRQPEGRKELVGFQAGVRESAQSWRLRHPARARAHDWSRARHRRRSGLLEGAGGDLSRHPPPALLGPQDSQCLEHGSRQTAAKAALHDIWMADGRAEAERAMNTFAAKYDAKYPQAVACLTKDRDALAFYDFPAEHCGISGRPIQSKALRYRPPPHRAHQGLLVSRDNSGMVFKLITTASKTWRRLMGNNQLPKVIEGVRFKDGMQVDETKTRAAA